MLKRTKLLVPFFVFALVVASISMVDGVFSIKTSIGQETIASDTIDVARAREDIYDEKADARKLIAEAVKQAKTDDKQVLVVWGANWCGWCHHLKEQCDSDSAIQKLLDEHYVSIRIDIGSRDKNMDLGLEYGADLNELGIPHLTILDSDGGVVTHRQPGTFAVIEKGSEKRVYSQKRIAGFLEKYKEGDPNRPEKTIKK